MNLFKDYLGNSIDLDDINAYPEEWKEINVHELFCKCMDTAGTSLFYMKYLHPDFDEGTQWFRVGKLCKELAAIFHYARRFKANDDEYRLELMKWLYRFEDEVENQC